jgi:hypothetical protein
MKQRDARGPIGSERRLSPRAVLWTSIVVALVLLCATAASGYVLHRNYDRASDTLNQRLGPASDTLNDLRATFNEERIACLNPGHLPFTESPGDWGATSATAVEQMSDLRRRVAPYQALDASAGRLETALRDWLGAAHTSAGAVTVHCDRTATAAGPSATTPLAAGGPGTAPQEGSARLAALDTRAAELSALLSDAKDQARADSADSRDAIVLFAEVSSLVLLGSALAFGIGASRRVITPLRVLEQRLHQAAVGTLDVPAPAPLRGWPKRVTTEMEGVYLRLKEYQWASRRDYEALEQNGASVLGLRGILAAHGAPGPGVAVHGDLVAAEGILAGDFFDTLALPDGSTVLVLGDVSGHGVQAGLLAVQLKCALLTACRLDPDLRTAARAAWSVLTDEDERFTTLVLLRIDPRERSLEWLNAGHEEPFLHRSGGGGDESGAVEGAVERLAATGPLVSSLIPDAADTWTVRRTSFAPGDTVVLCTDGLTEARNADGVQLGEQAVEDCLRRLPSGTPLEVVRGLYLAAERHGTDWQRDDITIVAATATATATDAAEGPETGGPETPEIR